MCHDCQTQCPRQSSTQIRCDDCRPIHNRRRNTELAARWRRVNREKVRAIGRDFHFRHRDKLRKKNRLWYQKNADRVRAAHSTDRYKSAQRSYEQRRRGNDPVFKLRKNVSRSIRASLSPRQKRHIGWQRAVGYTAQELRDHLERQFLRGMTWDNYGYGFGRWNIDHILPQSTFLFESIDDVAFKACWALTNLRPLWSDDNLRKQANRTHLI
jgi:hypothetical protein